MCIYRHICIFTPHFTRVFRILQVYRPCTSRVSHVYHVTMSATLRGFTCRHEIHTPRVTRYTLSQCAVCPHRDTAHNVTRSTLSTPKQCPTMSRTMSTKPTPSTPRNTRKQRTQRHTSPLRRPRRPSYATMPHVVNVVHNATQRLTLCCVVYITFTLCNFVDVVEGYGAWGVFRCLAGCV